MKPSKPPSPLVPRLAALAAMSVLLAIPVIIPLVVMKVTGTNGKSYYLLENSIVAPPSIVPVLPEETTPEEVVESFLKIGKNATVGPGGWLVHDVFALLLEVPAVSTIGQPACTLCERRCSATSAAVG